jgi:FkbM family methyltransferase
MLSPNLRRQIRQRGPVEYAVCKLRGTNKIALPIIGFEIDIRPGDVVLDCGANVGDVTSKFARTGARVYAFEPNPICFEVIKQRFRWMPNVTCLNKGVMDRDCVLTLTTPAPHAGFDELEVTVAASFKPNEVAAYPTTANEIACVDIDRFVRSLGSRVRLMKVDIEGAEIEVLNRLMDTGSIDLIDQLVVETHEEQMTDLAAPTRELRDRINKMGLSDKIRLDWI